MQIFGFVVNRRSAQEFLGIGVDVHWSPQKFGSIDGRRLRCRFEETPKVHLPVRLQVIIEPIAASTACRQNEAVVLRFLQNGRHFLPCGARHDNWLHRE